MANELMTYGADENVVVYRSADNAVQLDVQLAEETVWLTQKQMAGLFDTTPQNITVHIRNIYKEEELEQEATCKDFLQVQELCTTLTYHDRFLIIDDETIYLIGASLKDAGKRLFAFTQMDASQIQAIKGRL